jgi:DNA invertase Pin-like site-specific DNA recombinase
LVDASQGIKTIEGNPAAHFQINILAAVAQFERELIAERVNAGIKAARERGAKLGRPTKHNAVYNTVKSLILEGRMPPRSAV